jgi:glucokinase
MGRALKLITQTARAFLSQFQLLEFLKRRYEQKHRVSVERVVSGPGIANV